MSIYLKWKAQNWEFLNSLTAVARKAMERNTGARGLRSILEQVLLDTMYDLPSMENVAKVVNDESVIQGESKPIILYNNIEKQRLLGLRFLSLK